MRFRETRVISPDYHRYNDSLRYVEHEKLKSAHRLGESIVERIGWTELPHEGKKFDISVDAFESDRFAKFLRDVSKHVDEKIMTDLISELYSPYHQK